MSNDSESLGRVSGTGIFKRSGVGTAHSGSKLSLRERSASDAVSTTQGILTYALYRWEKERALVCLRLQYPPC